MKIMGISCYYHDSSACLINDGIVVAAAQEERFNRKKNCSELPIEAINFCVQYSGISFRDIDCICFYEKPYLKFARVMIDHINAFPYSYQLFMQTIPHWLKDRLVLPLVLKNELNFNGKVLFSKHHLSHAASAFYGSPFNESAIVVADGVGETDTTTIARGYDKDIIPIKEMSYPNSIGLLYTTITTYLGFAANSGEGKTMGLAGYGKPKYLNEMAKICRLFADGSFELELKYFQFYSGKRMYSKYLERLLGPARQETDKLEEKHMDIAASVQKFTENILIDIANTAYELTHSENLCLAGGVFLNCIANHKILERSKFKNIFIQPAAGDAGGCLGASLHALHSVFRKPRSWSMENAFLGPSYSDMQIERSLLVARLKFHKLSDDELLQQVAECLANDKIVGWFQGRMEFGPRALGNRSILASPQNPQMKNILNKKIKKREEFRPFAPVILEERAGDYFELLGKSPFMLLAAKVKDEVKDKIPSVVHVDGTARIQTLSRSSNIRLYNLIEMFDKITDCPILMNTSFNENSEPIVCSPENAISCFKRCELDLLVMGNYLVTTGY